MDFWEVVSPYLAPAGLAILVLTFVLRLRRQYRAEAERQYRRQRANTIETPVGRTPLTNNGGRGLPRQPSQLLKQEPLFTGNNNPASALARWEVEIDALGRQVIGQIQSKMVALQTLLLETERLANRVELLLERLDESSKQQVLRTTIAPLTLTPVPVSVHDAPRTACPIDVPTDALAADDSASESADDDTSLDAAIEAVVGRRAGSAGGGRPIPSSLAEMPAVEREITLPSIPVASLAHDPLHRRERDSDAVLLANYGYSPREIAARLNASIGEVESLLKATG